MIQRLRFDGYRLLDGFDADLGALTVVIGANACGKSTLLDALSLVTHGVDLTIDDVIAYRGGMWSIPNSGRQCDEIGWRLEFSKPRVHRQWSQIPIADDAVCIYEGRLGRDRVGAVVPRSECLRYAQPRPGKNQPFKFLESDGVWTRIFDPSTGKLTRFDAPTPSTMSQSPTPALEAEVPAERSPAQKPSLALSRMRFEHQFPVPTWIRAYLANFHYYPGFDVGRGSAVRSKAAEIRPQTVLNANGDNLGTVLHEVLTRDDFRDQESELLDYIRAAYPHVERMSVETAFGGEPRVLVRVRESGLQRATEVWELSDGFLRFLLLCTALLNPVPPAFIAIEEPEAGLHPRLLPIVADVIRSASERTQVLITTHSPQLLNAFALKDVAVMVREGARAVWKRPGDRKALRQMLDSQIGGTLGELHAAGELEALY